MTPETAICLVSNIVMLPGWELSACDHSDRFEGSIKLELHYTVPNTNRENAPCYDTELSTYASEPIFVINCNDPVELYRRIINWIAEVQLHELREAFRIAPTMWAPFHPHKQDGMERWGTPERDLKFGVA